MTTLDDQLTRLLQEAADTIAPDDAGKDRILAAATARAGSGDELDEGDDGDAPPRRAGTRRGRPLAVLVAAAIAAIVVAIVITSLAATGAFSTRYEPLSAHQLVAPSTTISDEKGFGTASEGRGLNAPSFPGAVGQGSVSQGSVSQGSTRTAPPAEGTVQTRVVAVGTVALSVAADRVQAVLSSLTTLAGREGGYVASSDATARSAGTAAKATVVLRIPERHFAVVVTDVQRDGTVSSVVTNSTDVTGQYVNYQDQIAAAEASRRQYLAIMARASTIADVLAIQSQLNQIQSQIDQLEGARNLLANQAAYGTLTIQLNESAPAPGHLSGFRHAVHDSVAGFVAAVEGLITGIGPTVFALLALGALLLIGRVVWRVARRRML